MGATKILGIVLLVAGLLGLFYGHFEYTKETHEGQFGPFRFSVAEKETAVIPSWASLAVVVAIVLVILLGNPVRVIPAGHVGVKDFFGRVASDVLTPCSGAHTFSADPS